MYFRTLASSSSGNSTLVWDESTAILVDAGISMRRIVCALRDTDLTPESISAIVVTHEHSDHIAALGMLSKYYGIPIYASPATAAGICRAYGCAEPFLHTVEPGASFEVGTLSLTTFPTPHDVEQSMGYRIESGDSSFAVATDLGMVTPAVSDALRGVDAAVVEANHDLQMLKYGPYPAALKRRILSDRGHLSNVVGGSLAAALAEQGARTIVLGHLSKHNNTPRLAYDAAAERLRAAGVEPEQDVTLSVAPADDPGKVYAVRS